MNLSGMHGLGDTIYIRSVLPKETAISLETPWPELFSDMPNVSVVKKNSKLRTQSQNEKNSAVRWSEKAGGTYQQIHYLPGVNIIDGIEKSSSLQFQGMTLPDFGSRPIKQKYAVIRPNTLRKEWPTKSRNCETKYINHCVNVLNGLGYETVSIAFVDGRNEVFDGEEPNASINFNYGDLSISEVLRYTQHADIVIGSVGWIVPAAIAQKRKAFIINGGAGFSNSKNIITHKKMDLSGIHFEEPDNFCLCKGHNHECKKWISGFEERFREWLTGLG